MKILFGTPETGARGGINACEPPFVEAIKNLGVETREEIYVFDHAARRTKSYERVGNVLGTARKFRRILTQNEFDIVHLNTAFDLKAVLRDLATVSLIGKKRAKIFLKMHGSESELLETKNHAARFLWQRLLSQIHGVGVLSNEEKENFVRAGMDKNKIFTVKNAVRVPNDLPPRRFDGEPLRLLFVSRFVPAKGLRQTIMAAIKLREAGFNVVLDCLGDGAERQPAEQIVEHFAASDYIKFHGHVTEETVNQFQRDSDLLVFPTNHPEGFPMVIFNALAHGLPVVTTRIRAAADYLSEPENVLWTKTNQSPSDVEDLCQKIDALYANPELRRRMSLNNRNRALEFSATRIAPEYLKIYEKIISRR